MQDQDLGEPQSHLGLALATATVLFLGALAGAKACGFVVLGPDDVTERLVLEAAERHANVFAAMAKCLSEPAVLTVADEPVSDCAPRKR